MRGINAQKAYYKCILLLCAKCPTWNGNDGQKPPKADKISTFGELFLACGTILVRLYFFAPAKSFNHCHRTDFLSND